MKRSRLGRSMTPEECSRRIDRLIRKGTSRIKPKRVKARKASHARQYPPHWRDEICAEQKWKCAYCRRSISREGARAATLDHVIPLSRGGKNCRKNLVAACSPCNTAKSSMSAEEFAASPKRHAGRPVAKAARNSDRSCLPGRS